MKIEKNDGFEWTKPLIFDKPCNSGVVLNLTYRAGNLAYYTMFGTPVFSAVQK